MRGRCPTSRVMSLPPVAAAFHAHPCGLRGSAALQRGDRTVEAPRGRLPSFWTSIYVPGSWRAQRGGPDRGFTLLNYASA